MKYTLRFSWLLTAISLTASVFAADLIDVYRQALQYDPAFQAAIATRLSQREALPQARADLLPQLSGAATLERVHRTNGVEDNVFPSVRHQKFSVHNYSLNLTQRIFNFGDWMEVKQASAAVKQAEANYNAAVQDLMIRTAHAYFTVLQAEDELAFTTAEKRANAKELDQAQQRYKVGIEPITSVYDAQARYDAVAAAEINARNNVDNSREALREITGQFYEKLAPLNSNKLPLIKPDPIRIESWVVVAERQNFALLGAKYGQIAAREQIKINSAGHLPTVDAVAAYNDENSLSTQSNTRFESRSRRVGVQMSVPLFQGGFVNSTVRQAKYDYQARVAEWQRTHRAVISLTHQSFNSIVSGIESIRAGRAAVKSAESSVESSEAAYKVGTRNLVDVLNAQRDLYRVKRDLSRAQYAYINNVLALKQAAGILTPNDLVNINRWLMMERNASSHS